MQGPNKSGSQGNVQTGAKSVTAAVAGAAKVKGGVNPQGCHCTGTAQSQKSGSKGG